MANEMTMDLDKKGLAIAIKQAKKSANEGGIPIGACLLAPNGDVLGQGHNQRVQRGSMTLHGEISALEACGRLKASEISKATMYTTLSPCSMCSGAALLYGIKRIVIGENVNFMGEEKWLASRGTQLVVVNDVECISMMKSFIEKNPQLWNEDIGEEDQ